MNNRIICEGLSRGAAQVLKRLLEKRFADSAMQIAVHNSIGGTVTLEAFTANNSSLEKKLKAVAFDWVMNRKHAEKHLAREHEIEERLGNATEGPWMWCQLKGLGAKTFLYSTAENEKSYREYGPIADDISGFDNCDFIANAPADIEYLLGRIRELEMKVRSAEIAIGPSET